MKNDIDVWIMDCLCMTPYYDAYLINAMKKYNPNTNFGSISFHLGREYFRAQNIINDAGLLDITSKLWIKNSLLKRPLKIMEYCINLLTFRYRFLIKKPDVVHIQWLPLITHFPMEMWFLKSLKKQGIKLVYTVHNVLPHDTGERYWTKFNKVYELVDGLICHTKETKTNLIQKFSLNPSKICIIPHGPMFHEVKMVNTNEAKDYLNIPQERVVILFFGTLRPYKGIEFLLESFKAVLNKRPEALLIIAGDGEAKYKQLLSDYIIKLGLTNSVKADFRYIPISELPIYHQAADILVYPYKIIDQSGALLTGMAYAKPIVATAVGGMLETLRNQNNGLLIKYGDIESFANAIIKLLDDPDLRFYLGKNALHDLEEKYSWDIIAQQTLRCYQEILI